jgi:hypothetical protein
MSRYDWPRQRSTSERDDPAGRARFVSPRRTEIDLPGALASGRRLGPARARARATTSGTGEPLFAPVDSRTDLWIPLGPATVYDGQAEGDPRVAGRVRALWVHPGGLRIYAATANGGVWYSSDGAETWRSIGGFAETDTPDIVRPAHRHACGAITVVLGADINDQTLDTVFVGTGEITPGRTAHAGSALGGIGILVATGPASGGLDDPWVEESPNLLHEGVYRFAVDPTGGTIVAATTIGLLQRQAAPGQDVDWERVAGEPFDDYESVVTDVLWTPAVGGGAPERLWVWAQNGSDAGLWVRDDGDTDFEKVGTPGAVRRRSSLAATDPPSRIFVFNDQGSANIAKLFEVTSAAADPTAAEVTGIPDMLGHQGFYDLAIRVDPNDPDRVILGGSFFEGPPDAVAVNRQNVNVTADAYNEDAAIFAARVVGAAGARTYGNAAAPPLRIGVGCHADVHDLQFSDTGDVLWAACDGGVFRSIFHDQNSGFVARNDGLSVVESNYVACHPTCEGRVVAGLQDNGLIERRSSAVWEHTSGGDGGGVAFDPRQPTRFVRQFFDGQWTASDGGPYGRMLAFRPLATPFALHADAATERDDSAFYSTPAAIAHHRGGAAAPTHTQVLIGTTRVWYTDDWANTWVTLPTATDPIGPINFNRKQDLHGEPITVCKWATSDVAWILSDNKLVRMVRVAGSDVAAPPGQWSRDPILDRGEKNKKDDTSAEGPIRDSVVWTDVEPNLDAPGNEHGTKGAVYLGTVGDPEDDEVDTLWWFDGEETWHCTLLRDEVTAPVTAIRCDPANPDDVYVGTTVGVWHGERTLGNPPTWDWRDLVNGLPEAAVEDLAVFDSGGLRLLRAGIAARGVWELNLDTPVADVTYLRAHDDDLRYRVRAIATQRDGVTARSWHGSPDVRPRIAPAAVAPPAAGVLLRRAAPGPAESLRRFQAAFRSSTADDRIRGTGEWDLYFEDVLRDHGAPPHPASGRMTIDAAFWTSMMSPPDDVAEPWATVGQPDRIPTEADLLELTPKIDEGAVGRVSMVVKAVAHKVDVVVHHRGFVPRLGSDVRVTLLRWTRRPADPLPRRDDPATWFQGNVPWAAAVDEVLNSAGGTTSISLAGTGWSFVGSNAATRRKTLTGQDLDNLHTGVATFDLDLSPFRNNTVMLLAAVIRAGGPSALATDTLENLAMTDPHVAVRSLVIEKP